MEQAFTIAALWFGLALLATFLAPKLEISMALMEIPVGNQHEHVMVDMVEEAPAPANTLDFALAPDNCSLVWPARHARGRLIVR